MSGAVGDRAHERGPRPSGNASVETGESWWSSVFGRIPLGRLEGFCQRMGIGLTSGLDVIRLLESEANRGGAQHGASMRQVIADIRQGHTLAQAMKRCGAYFPPLLIQMVEAGETSGRLDRLFLHMSEHYRDLQGARRQFLGQIAWPLIQLGMAIAIICLVIALRGFLAQGPSESSYDALGLGLSGASGVAIFLGWVTVIGLSVMALGIAIWKNAFQCHRWLVRWVLPIPVLGSVFSNLAMARMSMTLSMLLNAGADAVRSLRHAFLSTGNDYYIRKMPIALESVELGRSLAESVAATHVFPAEFIQGIEIGEMSGNETESLDRLAVEYSRRARAALTQLSMVAGIAIWIAIAALIIALILRMAMQYVNMLQSLM